MEPGGSLYSLQMPPFPYPERDQSNLHPPCHFLNINLILYCHLRLCFPNNIFPSGYATTNLYATCPAPLTLLDLIIQITCEENRSWSSSLRILLQSPVMSSLLGPNIFLSTLFSNSLTHRQCDIPRLTPIQKERTAIFNRRWEMRSLWCQM